jgi:hypothetical protein
MNMPSYDIFTHTKKTPLRHLFYARRSRTHDFQLPIKIVMEGEVEADAGVANDAGETYYASEPPAGPNHTPSVIHGPVDIAFTVSTSKSSHEDAGRDRGKFVSGGCRGGGP